LEFLIDYGLFLAKAITILAVIVIVVSMISALSHRGGGRKEHRGHIEVTRLNDWYKHMGDTLKKAVLDSNLIKHQAKLAKQKLKKDKTEKKQALKKKSADHETPAQKRVFVLNFDGDIKASATTNLKEEITTVLSVAQPSDEVVLRLESAGGMVHSYGLAASQLLRIKNKKIPLTVCVDKVAASGGYMMACIADNIVAAPFAIIGSIGVVGQLPNFHRLLQKIPIDYEMQTAGEYKRTLTLFAENTDKGRQKFAEELEDTHGLFKTFIRDNREQLDVDAVATGETWYGSRALEKQLIDTIQTSDEYLTGQAGEADIFEVEYVLKKSFPERLGIASQQAMDRLLLTWCDRLRTSRFLS
jgi:serine protease SohB